MSVTLPGPTSRTAICGSTGSGKTFAGVWHLSRADFHLRPWFLIDYKRDKLLGQLGATVIDHHKALPTLPGLYLVQPMPDDTLEDFFWKVWRQEYCGLYIDEGYMVGNRNRAFRACLTQGRSKHIQMITLSQRPVWMDRFVFSEAEYFQIFRLNDLRDYDTLQSMISCDIKSRLPKFHSRWYDVGADMGVEFSPVPTRADLISIFKARVPRQIRTV